MKTFAVVRHWKLCKKATIFGVLKLLDMNLSYETYLAIHGKLYQIFQRVEKN